MEARVELSTFRKKQGEMMTQEKITLEPRYFSENTKGNLAKAILFSIAEDPYGDPVTLPREEAIAIAQVAATLAVAAEIDELRKALDR